MTNFKHKNVLFHSNQASERGTEVALYDYAKYYEMITGGKAFIAFSSSGNNMESVLKHFRGTFPERVFIYDSFEQVNQYCVENNITAGYFIKSGENDNKIVTLEGFTNLVHAVFNPTQPHGQKYVAVGKWLSEQHNIDYLDHIVDDFDCFPYMTDNNKSLRDYLNIPDEKIVFGRIGGKDSFDDREVIASVYSALYDFTYDPSLFHFVFVNTDLPHAIASHPNVSNIESITTDSHKYLFYRSLDYFLYGRHRGETFGLAICDAMNYNIPVICSTKAIERNHIMNLGSAGIYFSNHIELNVIMENIILSKKRKYTNTRDFIQKNYSPEIVMKKFLSLLNG